MINMHMMQTNIGVQEQHNCKTDNCRDMEVDYGLSLVQDNKVLTKTEIRLTKHPSPLEWGCNLEVQISNNLTHNASHQAPDHSLCKFQTGIDHQSRKWSELIKTRTVPRNNERQFRTMSSSCFSHSCSQFWRQSQLNLDSNNKSDLSQILELSWVFEPQSEVEVKVRCRSNAAANMASISNSKCNEDKDSKFHRNLNH